MRYLPGKILLAASLAWFFAVHAVGETVLLPMADGTRLATDLYLPDGPGPFPVVLVRTTYNKNNLDKNARNFMRQGYASVMQDTRGLMASEGTFTGSADGGWGAHRDGADTVAWIRKQSWCNGKVASWGPSALGITQVMLAGAGADMTCQYIQVAASNFYDQVSYQGGVLRKNLVEEWLKSRGTPHVIGIYKSHPYYDGYWALFNAEIRAPEITAPAVHIGGWYDVFAKGTLNNFVSRQQNGAKGARGNQKLIMGPWPHVVMQEYGDLKFPDNYNFDLSGYRQRFFKYWLLGEQNGIMAEPAVHYYTMGDCSDPNAPGNQWRSADHWPPFPARETPYYLAWDEEPDRVDRGPEKGDGLALDSGPNHSGNLTANLGQIHDATAGYDYDPANPCPTHGGANLRMGPLDGGPFDQRQLARRPDVLTFSTPPLEKPLEITGAVRLKLYVSTSATDTDFTAKLLDIYPDGRQILLTDNIQRVKLRNGFERPDLLPPGAVGELTIDLWSLSLVLNRAHRIGLQISSSNYPRFEKNPNTGDDFPEGEHRQIAHNTIHMGPTHPSALLLPVRP